MYTEISKSQFIDILTTKKAALIYGGFLPFCPFDTDENREKITNAVKNISVDNYKAYKVNNAKTRAVSDSGNVLEFASRCNFFQSGKIIARVQSFKDYNKKNYCIYSIL